jgi:hypothetical protein
VNKLRILGATTLLLSLGVSAAALGEEPTDQQRAMKFHENRLKAGDTWRNLSAEQQQAAIAKAEGAWDKLAPAAKNSWNKLTPEQQAQALSEAKARGASAAQRGKAAYEGLSTEERQQIKQDNAAQRAERRATRQPESPSQ